MKSKPAIIILSALIILLAQGIPAKSVDLHRITVTLGTNSGDYASGDDTDRLDIDVGNNFYIFIILEPDETEENVDILIDVYFDDILVLEEYDGIDNIDLKKEVDYPITLDAGDFDDIWEDTFLGYDCGGHDIEVKVYGDDLDDEYKDTVDLDIDDDKKFDTVTMSPEEPDVGDEITIYVEDEDGDELDDAYVKIYHLGDDDEWDDRDEDYYDKTDNDGEAIFTLEDEFDPAIGKYLIFVVEGSSGGDYCRWSETFSVKRELKITEMPSDIRAGEEMTLKVVDVNDNPIAYADVTISGPGGFRITHSTDADGYAYFTLNDSGGFSIVATKEKYDDSLIKNFEVKQRGGLTIEIKPEDMSVGNALTIKVTSKGKAVDNAAVKIKKPNGAFESTIRTSSNGEVAYTPPDTGTYEAEVSKQTYEISTKKFTVFNKFVVSIAANVAINEDVSITVKDQGGNAVNGAIISVGGIKVATTDINGAASFTIERSGRHMVGVSKEGFKEFSKELTAEGSLTLELDETEIDLDEGITITVRDMKNKPIEADIKINEPDGGVVEETGSEYVFKPETAGDYTVTASKTGYSPDSADLRVLPYTVAVSTEISGNYLVIKASRGNVPMENLTISVVTPESREELFMYTDDEGVTRLDLGELNERGNFTIRVDGVNYRSDTVVEEITTWGGFDFMSTILLVLAVIIIALVIVIVFVYSGGKGKDGKKPKTETLKTVRKGTKLGGKLGGLGKV